jgi:hypothetical protein
MENGAGLPLPWTQEIPSPKPSPSETATFTPSPPTTPELLSEVFRDQGRENLAGILTLLVKQAKASFGLARI